MALAALAGLSPARAADTALRDAAICASLVAGARDALALGYADAAIELVDEALSFVPSDPDANYLRTLLGLSRGEPLARASGRLATALAGGGWRLYQEDDARLLYASVLARTGSPAMALGFLDGLPPSAEALYVETVASLALGHEARARAAARSSLRRYPSDPRAIMAWLGSADRPFRSGPDAELVAAGFSSLGSLKEADPGILVALAPYAPSAEEARLLIREFRAAGGSSPDATVSALALGLIREDRAIAELFSGAYVPDHRHLRSLFGLLSDDGARERFYAAFAAFSGTVVLDGDRDGAPESTTSYQAGLPAGWVLDRDQDGVPEMEASFSDGAPSIVRARAGSATLTVRYGRWPHAESIAYADGAGTRTYSVAPAVLALPLVALGRLPGTRGGPLLIERSETPLPTESAALAHAYAARKDGPGSETVLLLDGQAERAWWTDAWRRTGGVVYRGGMPIRELVDADGDGRAETRRVWRRGADGTPEPAYAEQDLDGDGIYEYRETLSGPPVRSWDYDGDGSADMTMASYDDGTAVYRYLGPPGSVTEASFKNGAIVSAVVGGLPAPLIPDSGGRVVWIGSKPFDFGSIAPSPGRGARGGVMYSVFSVAGSLYAQVVD